MVATPRNCDSLDTKKLLLICDCGCGTRFPRSRSKAGPRHFVNKKHAAAAEQRECTIKQCGPFLDLFTEYFEGAARHRYRNLINVRKALRPFFLFLHTNGVLDLQSVTSATITSFRSWGLSNGHKNAANDTSALSIFFDWAILEERYSGDNPVIPALHGKRKSSTDARPYSTDEMQHIRELLDERGNERLRAFFEIAAESGMRASEICRLRLQDVSLQSSDLFVGLPNKSLAERKAFFYTRAKQRIQEWLSVRREDSGHEFLFHNRFGQPLKYDSIHHEFNTTLCIRSGGKARNLTGLHAFSLHRLRHTLSSVLASNGADANTQMKCLGWASLSPIDTYTKIDEDSKKRTFVAAMNKAEEWKGDEPKQVLSPEEFLSTLGA